MPIIIMKTDLSPIYGDWVRPHSVFEGTKKQAEKWCNAKNANPRNHRTIYSAVSIKTEKPLQK